VTATGTAPLNYQWYIGSSGTTTNPINAATGSSFTTPALTSTTSYWVRVSNSAGHADSNTATITTIAPPGLTVLPTTGVLSANLVWPPTGTTFVISATGLAPNLGVPYDYNAPLWATTGTTNCFGGTWAANSSGTATCSFGVVGVGDIFSPGTFSVRVGFNLTTPPYGTIWSNWATVTVNRLPVNPQISVDKTCGPAGTTFNISGSGFSQFGTTTFCSVRRECVGHGIVDALGHLNPPEGDYIGVSPWSEEVWIQDDISGRLSNHVTFHTPCP
jgi:hypothetical protein